MIFTTLIPPTAPPSFVLDLSVAASWAIPLQYTVYSHRVQSRLAMGTAAIVATNWPLDLIDRFITAVSRTETTQQRVGNSLVSLQFYRIYLDVDGPHRAWPELFDLVRVYSVPTRDAAYLDLALRMGLPLATIDPALTRAASAAGVSIFTP